MYLFNLMPSDHLSYITIHWFLPPYIFKEDSETLQSPSAFIMLETKINKGKVMGVLPIQKEDVQDIESSSGLQNSFCLLTRIRLKANQIRLT